MADAEVLREALDREGGGLEENSSARAMGGVLAIVAAVLGLYSVMEPMWQTQEYLRHDLETSQADVRALTTNLTETREKLAHVTGAFEEHVKAGDSAIVRGERRR